MLQENDLAPDFEGLADSGQPVKLSDFRGKKILLYFYPKAMTSGCTIQACALRDDFSLYEQAGVVVIGVSPDPVKRQAKFKEKEGLPFILLADENHEVAEKYGVWVEKSMYGRTYWGNERSSFLIGPDDVIERIFRKVKPEAHSRQVLAALAAA
ncbi:MAG: thioredoxin-dependent thiol peroxidase [Chloroflexota bacterium]